MIKVCPICYMSNCNHNYPKFEVDYNIYDVIKILNLKGYKTEYCCGGHIDIASISNDVYPSIYIKFNRFSVNPFDASKIGEGWVLKRTNMVLEYSFNPKNMSDLSLYDKKITCIKVLSEKRNELKKWAMSLPRNVKH